MSVISGRYEISMNEMRPISPAEHVMPILIGRYGALVGNDSRMRRYLDVMPQVIDEMQHSLEGGYNTLFPVFTKILPLIALGDDTPQRCKFAPSMLGEWNTSRQELASALAAYYDRWDLSTYERNDKVNKYLRALTQHFSNHMQAHMGLEQLQFFEISLITGKQGQEAYVPALSIDRAQLLPLMERCGVTDEAEFLGLLGVDKRQVAVYPGSQGASNGIDARVVIVDPKGIAHLKAIGAPITLDPAAHVVQAKFPGKAKKTVSGPSASVLPWKEWTTKVEERRARREARHQPETTR